jgi:hypothetical protein
MSGCLDNNAPSIDAESGRYLDGDILGKVITKNFLLNVIGYEAGQVYIPVGRYGNAAEKYDASGRIQPDLGDGHVQTSQGRVTFEIKCARINIANRYKLESAENWAFVNIKTTPAKVPKAYDVLIAIGLHTLGLEDSNYWTHLEQLREQYRAQGREMLPTAQPHEQAYLPLCTFFLLRREELKTNYFRLTLRSMGKSAYNEVAANGDDLRRCKELWARATG